ncbi:MAG: 16S rRNA (uracil(1498)-N(3))-methyltransferase [Defluviitaleaceae bacterium]|nr:16S rRNA (uracil(1498)-N(3))-methyltransferase [Defluviitaleaceae bacterium]
MSKYFFKPSARDGDIVRFTGSTAHHMLHVLRLRVGQEVILCDGNGIDYHSTLESIMVKPDTADFKIHSHSPSMTEPAIPITLFQGLPKGDKLDWIIEKTIEMGITKIIPVCTARTVVKVKDAAKKAERFARISESAASQSMRGIIPEVTPPISFNEAVANHDSTSTCLIAYEKENHRTINTLESGVIPKSISLWVGPEGGFEDYEVQTLKDKGGRTISLGPRILRTETAGLVALAQILCIYGL